MPQLGDVPPELLVYVANEVHPADIVNFAVVCRGFQAAASQALKLHQTYSFQFRKLVGDFHGSCNTDTFSLLEEVLQEPRRAHYIHTFELNGWPCRLIGDEVNAPNFCERHAQILNKSIEAAALGSKFKWGSGRKLLNTRPIFLLGALVLCNLPNLIVLDWQADNVNVTPLVPKLIRAIANTSSGIALKKLRKVILQRDRTGGSIPLDYAAAFMCLPALESISAGALDWDSCLLPPGSSVTNISLSYNSIKKHNKILFEEMVATPRQLKSLALRWPQDRLFKPSVVRDILLTHAKDTLERLVIRTGGLHVGTLGDLSDFECLRYLETDVSVIIITRDINVDTARKLLPRSLEHLRLHEEEAEILLEQAVEGAGNLITYKQTAFPKLAKLDIGLAIMYHDESSSDEFDLEDYIQKITDSMAAKCKRKGIEFTAQPSGYFTFDD